MHQRTLPPRTLPNGDRVETVIFNGNRFRRYPDAPRQSDQRYFTPGISDRQAGLKRLHEEVWMIANNATIPPGYQVHHIDHDHGNNEPDNLVIMDSEDHLEHHKEDWAKDPVLLAQLRANMAKAREAAKAWHRSPEGLSWHQEHGRKVMASRELVELVCQQCGAKYSTLQRGDGTRFCSNLCKSAWRRESGHDDVERTCAYCGNSFHVNKYKKTKNCSRSCATSYRYANRT